MCEDDELLVLFANGDARVAAVLIARHTPRVLSLARHMLNDLTEAEDVAQETMLRLWRIAGDWRRGEARVSTWLYGVARNLCIDRLRRRRTVGLEGIDEPVDDTPDVTTTMHSAVRAQALRDALAKLPDRQREAVVLRHIEGLGNPEIAEILHTSTEAVESLTARGKRALSAILLVKKDMLGLVS